MNKTVQLIKHFIYSRYFILFTGVVLILVSQFIYNSRYAKVNPKKLEQRTQKIFIDKINDAETLCEKLFNLVNTNEKKFFVSDISDNYIKKLPDILIYKDHKLIFWNNNSILFSGDLSDFNKIIKTGTGWYYPVQYMVNEYQIIIAVKIRNEYAFNNAYLQSAYITDFYLPENSGITVEEKYADLKINDKAGNFVFGVTLPKEKQALSSTALLLVLTLVIFGILLIVYFIRKECLFLQNNIGKINAALLFILTITVLRYWSLSMEFPAIFYQYRLFSPELYAESVLFPSLGDFLINALLLLYICYYLSGIAPVIKFHKKIPAWAITIIFLIFLSITAIFSSYTGSLIHSLVLNSNIELHFQNIFQLSAYSFAGFAVAGALLFSYYFLNEFFFNLLITQNFNKWRALLFVIPLFLVSWFSNALFEQKDIVFIIWPVMLFVILYISYFHYQKKSGFNFTVLQLIVFALFSSYAFTTFTNDKEKEKRLQQAQKLATDEDPLIEIAYSELEPQLLNSPLINNAFSGSHNFSKNEFEKEIEKTYFKGDWNNYDLKFYLYSADSSALGIEGFAPIFEFDDLNNIVDLYGIPSKFNPNMYFIYNSFYKLSYLIKLPVKTTGKQTIKGFLFCEVRSKKIPEDIGFPELLLDKTGRNDVIHQYSYARYVDGMQVNSFGKYRYSLNSNIYERTPFQHDFFNSENFNHLVYRVNEGTIIILSKENDNWLTDVTGFSYLFTLYSLVFVFAFAIRQLLHGNTNLNLTMQGKMQFMMVGILVFALFLFGLGTRYYISSQYSEKNNRILSEKIRSVKMELYQKIANDDKLDDNKNYVGYLLQKFSLVFMSDIHLYTPDGKLFASSRPDIFDYGLQSQQIHPLAYRQMHFYNKSEYIQNEQIGNMNFLSAYCPLTNYKNQLLGYLNLAYFSKYSALETEISNFLVAIINIFILLLALSLLAALFVSNWITKPLQLIQNHIARLEPGKTNTPIKYSGHDEIGTLVAQYNKKLEELEHYARELARSERESAWREMAKQVAHEIKNPLTPMRLSVQHIERTLDANDPEWKEKLKRFSTMLIEQIDTLTHIANEFSNFAKMPRAKEEKTNLNTLIQSALQLYDKTPGIQFKFTCTENEAYVFCDKEQMLRVFNNLIKNAIQAIPDEHENGKIEIILKTSNEGYLCEVKDNGNGIEPDAIEKIFTPNFTTKTTGMGLGLAMVKNIVENAQGKIWFETTYKTGTSFYVWLPKHSG